MNDNPVAKDDTVSATEDTDKIITVLSNDTDADGNTLTISSTTNPSHGTITVNADNTITYKPTADYNGDDEFTYTISDGNGGTSTATVTITVSAVNDNPVAKDDTDADGVKQVATVKNIHNPKTSDNSNLFLNILLTIVSLFSGLTLFTQKIKKLYINRCVIQIYNPWGNSIVAVVGYDATNQFLLLNLYLYQFSRYLSKSY